MCQPLPVITFELLYYSEEFPAIISVLTSATMTAMSVWFMLTAGEKRVLRSGYLPTRQQQPGVQSLVQRRLKDHVGLNQVL
jgi:hypothetical protein